MRTVELIVTVTVPDYLTDDDILDEVVDALTDYDISAHIQFSEKQLAAQPDDL